MLADVLAWALILGVAYVVGRGVLAAFGARMLRTGDRVLLAMWSGLGIVSSALLGVSLIVPLTAVAGLLTVAVLAASGTLLDRRFGNGHEPNDLPWRAKPIVLAALVIAIGASILTSDRVTLYDSLVYHVGIARWLHEYGTVPGVALIHNRLGHVSSWLALGAPFDGGVLAGRATTIPLGVALMLVALQAAMAAARIATVRAIRADWFLFLASLALAWAALRHNAANPSPDAGASAMIVATAWSILVAGSQPIRRNPEARFGQLTPWLIPVLIATGAVTIKLFAVPAVIAAAFAYVTAGTASQGTRGVAHRVLVCAALGLIVGGPFLAANVVASGCPLFPSTVLCADVPWAIPRADVADYARYIRDVARWEARRSFIGLSDTAWVFPWIRAHWLLTLAALASVVGGVALARTHRDRASTYPVAVGLLGIAFTAIQAPAPRFLYVYALIVPLTAVSTVVTPRWAAVRSLAPRSDADETRRIAYAVVATAILMAAIYALPSQKVNLLSGIRSGGEVLSVSRTDLILPARVEAPPTLLRWTVNDVTGVTPVPPGVADTLGYRSVIDANSSVEKCSSAPLPCTPYRPRPDIRLRKPARGTAGGFAHARYETTP
jgi:hypothetical protein